MRRNIDAWWPEMSRGDTLLIATASGCGSELKEMGEALKHDEAYRDKAHTIASAARDVAEVLAPLMDLIVTHIPEHRRPEDEHRRIVYHPPCSLQHGQKIRGVVEAILVRLGYELLPFKESHLCCGSAGSYSLLEKSMSTTLKLRKLGHLLTPHPSLIATANIGCQVHLQSGTQVPVIHWVKLMDAMMTPQS
jgi:glycolate oxidase iron-sulfur subunit